MCTTSYAEPWGSPCDFTGFWAASSKHSRTGETRQQRCWMHKFRHANVLNCLPKSISGQSQAGPACDLAG